MKQDKSLRCMVSIPNASENTALPLYGNFLQTFSTICRLQQSQKTIYSACMRVSPRLSSTYQISKRSKESRKYLTKDPMLTWSGPILTLTLATQDSPCQREEPVICSESTLSINFCMKMECLRFLERTNFAWRDIKSSLMENSALSGALQITAIDSKTWQVSSNLMNSWKCISIYTKMHQKTKGTRRLKAVYSGTPKTTRLTINFSCDHKYSLTSAISLYKI